jgi:hypothetical protein
MQAEYRSHLIRDYGKKVVEWFESERRKVNPVKDWQAVIEAFKGAK